MVKLKLFGIGGVPGSGKSTLVRELVYKYDCTHLFKYGTLEGHKRISPNDVIVFGKYAMNDLFPGTDRLSMAVINDALAYMKYLHSGMCNRTENVHVIFEGDRLFVDRFLDESSADEKIFMVLQTDPDVLKSRMEKRIQLRGKAQPEQFLRSRRTKIRNMLNRRKDIFVEPFNDDKDFERIMDMFSNFIAPF
jgi:broad-specificity NMP kinase